MGLVVPMEGTRRRRAPKAVWDPAECEDSRPQWREALTTRVLYREVCGLAARENGLAHLNFSHPPLPRFDEDLMQLEGD